MARFQLKSKCRPMLKTNYRIVQSLNISLDVAKCNVKMFTNSPSTFTFANCIGIFILVVEWNKSAFGGVVLLNIRALIFRKDALYDATPNFALLF